MSYDLVIRNGKVVDGLGNQPVLADLAVDGDQIAEIGDISAKGKQEIDANGNVVTPGFVDLHTHFDAQVGWDPALFHHQLSTCHSLSQKSSLYNSYHLTSHLSRRLQFQVLSTDFKVKY